MYQLLLIVDYMHCQGGVHRDLKPQNVLLVSNPQSSDPSHIEIKVIDFGLSQIADKNIKLFRQCGSPGYVSPEILTGDGCNEKTDIFSVGTIFYNLLTGRSLFPGDDCDEVLYLNKHCDFSSQKKYLNRIPYVALNLLLSLIEANPMRRSSAREALKHSFFSDLRPCIDYCLQTNSRLSTQTSFQSTIDEESSENSSLEKGRNSSLSKAQTCATEYGYNK